MFNELKFWFELSFVIFEWWKVVWVYKKFIKKKEVELFFYGIMY